MHSLETLPRRTNPHLHRTPALLAVGDLRVRPKTKTPKARSPNRPTATRPRVPASTTALKANTPPLNAATPSFNAPVAAIPHLAQASLVSPSRTRTPVTLLLPSHKPTTSCTHQSLPRLPAKLSQSSRAHPSVRLVGRVPTCVALDGVTVVRPTLSTQSRMSYVTNASRRTRTPSPAHGSTRLPLLM